MTREADLERFYAILGGLRDQAGGFRRLATSNGRMEWPQRGVYFFFEEGELRRCTAALRVVRVGTHALRTGSRTTLWNRLSQHKGHAEGAHPGGGNHRGSIFRLHVGDALLNKSVYSTEIRQTWGRGSNADRPTRDLEYALEKDVSAYIGRMPFLWVGVDDPPGPGSDRGVIERGSVALLSSFRQPAIDPASPHWLGLQSTRQEIRESGLWNIDYVNERYDPDFLDVLSRYAKVVQ
jgi:hypothetical protein